MRRIPLTYRYAILGGLVVVGYATVALLLEWIGTSSPSLRRDPDVWGTYGDWGAAIIPATAGLASVGIWLRDKSDLAERRSRRLADGIRLEDRFEILWLVNGSIGEIRCRGETLRPGEETENFILENWIVLSDGSLWKFDNSRTLQPV